MEPLLSFLFGLAVASAIIGAAGFIWWINEHTKRLAADVHIAGLEAKLSALDRLHSLAEKQNHALIQKLERQGAYIYHLQKIVGEQHSCGGVILGGVLTQQEDEEDEENPPVSGLN